MYFPKNFDRRLSIEIAELVIQAYDQFDASLAKKTWNLNGGYTMIKELLLPATGSNLLLNENSMFTKELNGFLESLGKKIKNLPIGYIARKKNDLYIIFRGTRTPDEWLRNLHIHLQPYTTPEIHENFGKVHEGFLNTYYQVRRDIQIALLDIKGIRNLYIGGHSLGGALGTLLVPGIVFQNIFKSVTIYTYGCPRVGDNTFTTSYNELQRVKTFRIANTSDLVTSVPFSAPFLGFVGGYFSHVETPVDFTIQQDDLAKNHQIEVYLAALQGARQSWEYFRRILSWIRFG